MYDFELDPEIRRFIDRYLAVSNYSTDTPIEQQRRDYQKVVAHFHSDWPNRVSSCDEAIEGRHGPIPIRRYRPSEDDQSARVFFFRGGGFVLGSLESHDDVCADLCAQTGLEIVSVDYRSAPEYLHPVQLDDVEDALSACWHDHTVLLGISAGGSLAAGLSHRLRSHSKKPAGQVLVYPTLGGDSFDLESYRSNANAPLLTTEDVRFYRGIRCENGLAPDNDAELLPLLADDFSGLPTTIAISAEVDPLRDDCALYVEKLQAASVEATWINEPGLTHDFVRARHCSRRAAEAFAHICSAITELAR